MKMTSINSKVKPTEIKTNIQNKAVSSFDEWKALALGKLEKLDSWLVNNVKSTLQSIGDYVNSDKNVDLASSNESFKDKFISSFSGVADFSKTAFTKSSDIIKRAINSKWWRIAKVALVKSWKVTKFVLKNSFKHPIKASLVTAAIYMAATHTGWMINDQGSYKKLTSADNIISQTMVASSVAKSLAADENVFWNVARAWTKSSDFAVRRQADGKVALMSYKFIKDVDIDNFTKKYKIEKSNIITKKISERETLETSVAFNDPSVNSAMKAKLKSFFADVANTTVTNWDDFQAVVVYDIDSKTAEKHKEAIEALKEYKMFDLKINK